MSSSATKQLVDKTVPVKIYVGTSRSKEKMVFNGYQGETIQHIAEREPDLNALIQCTCGGNSACSTCHVYVSDDYFKKLKPADEDEQDMLDLAWGYKDQSRLGCCIVLSKDIDGLDITIPSGVNDLF
jgi:ferredoxin